MKQTFIFIGRSGCGKGTQADLLIEYLKNRGDISNDHPLFYMETGDGFRKLVAGTSHTSRLAKTIMDDGDRQPDFLAVWMWSHCLLENLMGDENVILDGTPRSLLEAQILDTAIKFYKLENVKVVHLDVSRAWAKERLEERGRGDDKKLNGIEKRLDWYEKDVEPAIGYFVGNKDYAYLKINGEQTIEQVHADIVKAFEGSLVPVATVGAVDCV